MCCRYVKDADKAIIARLKAEGRIVKVEVEHHSYPFCWRSDTPLIYKVLYYELVGLGNLDILRPGTDEWLQCAPHAQ